MNSNPSTVVSRTLVIPDIHNDFARAEAFIARLAGRYDRIVFLGDYFDDFGDTPEIARGVAAWLQHSFAQGNRTHLVGNHDLPYLFPGRSSCPGFSEEKMRAVAPILRLLPQQEFRAAIEIDGWLLSHAGFLPCYASGRSAASLAVWADSLLRQLAAGGRPTLFAAGPARGGQSPIAGITWCDWDQEFVPTEGIHQIVGHTPARTVRVDSMAPTDAVLSRERFALEAIAGKSFSYGEYESLNICLDTRLRCVALIEAGKLTVVTDVVAGPVPAKIHE